MYTFVSKSEDETIEFAKSLASKLSAGDIVVLTGELGAGKTKFVEGFLTHFGLQNEISSHTFTIVNEYISENNTNIYHFDVYRLADVDEFYAMGGEEYFEKGICLIEWGEIIKEALPSSYLHITIDKDETNENNRIIKIDSVGNKYNGLF